jgi:hypothetical protein
MAMRSKFGWAGAFVAVATVLAVLASSALAEVWQTEAFKFTAGQSESFKSGIVSEKFLIQGEFLGWPLKITATGLECLECKIAQTGEGEAGVAGGTAKYKFTGVKLVEPAACATPSTFTTEPLVETYFPRTGSGLLELKPAKGTTLAGITIAGCIKEKPVPLTGTLDGRTKELGFIAVFPTVKFSPTIETEEGGTLQFAFNPASLTGELFNELSGTNEGRMWGVAAK